MKKVCINCQWWGKKWIKGLLRVCNCSGHHRPGRVMTSEPFATCEYWAAMEKPATKIW